LERLRQGIRDLHGCESAHPASIAVHETVEGKTVWQEIVEVFTLIGHPTAKHAYAWSYENEGGKWHHVVVLEITPINSAYDAVRTYYSG
jgi:hypothetical protein